MCSTTTAARRLSAPWGKGQCGGDRPRSSLCLHCTPGSLVRRHAEQAAGRQMRHVIEGMPGAFWDPAAVPGVKLNPPPGVGELDVQVALLHEDHLVPLVNEDVASLAGQKLDLPNGHVFGAGQ